MSKNALFLIKMFFLASIWVVLIVATSTHEKAPAKMSGGAVATIVSQPTAIKGEYGDDISLVRTATARTISGEEMRVLVIEPEVTTGSEVRVYEVQQGFKDARFALLNK